MNKAASLLLALAAIIGLTAPAKAATIGRIFALQFDSSTNDFLGLNAGGYPKTLLLLADINDGGNYTQLRLFDGAVSNNLQVASFDLSGSNWTIGNGAQDTFTLTALQQGTPNLLNFTIANLPDRVTNTNQTVANADAILRIPAILPSAFSFVNLGTGQGYQGQVLAVPEPSSMALLLGCVAGVGAFRRRRR